MAKGNSGLQVFNFRVQGVHMRKIVILCCVLVCITTLPSTLLAQVSDVTPPTLVDLAFPSGVDTSASDQNVTVTADVTDDISGFNYLYVYFKSPSGFQTNNAYVDSSGIIAGSMRSGRFIGNVTFPKYSEQGIWTVDGAYIKDQAGNSDNLTKAELAAMGMPTTFMVTSTNPDITPPTMTDIKFNPPVVDVSSGAGNISVELKIQDDLSGVKSVSLQAKSPSGNQYVYNYNSIIMVGPDRFAVSIRIPQSAEAGDWQIGKLYIYDKAGNFNYLTPATWPSGLPNTFTVISAPPDTMAPNLANLSFSPKYINTSEGSQNVSVSFTLTDDQSGMAPLTSPSGDTYGVASISFQSPSGAQTASANVSQQSQLVDGTALNGIWQTSVNFPQYSETGTWMVTSVSIWDSARNNRYFSTGDLVAAGLQTDIIITSPSSSIDGTIPPNTNTTVQDQQTAQPGTAQVEAPAGVLPPEQINVTITVLSSAPSTPSPQGFGAPGTSFMSVQLEPKPNYPLPAPGLTITIPIPAGGTPGVSLPLFRINEATGTLIPAYDANGDQIVGKVNPDGLSAEFKGITALSTLVALTPTPGSHKLGDVTNDGIVNCDDLNLVMSSLGRRLGQTGYKSQADINNDGVIDLLDLMYVSRQLPNGTTCPR